MQKVLLKTSVDKETFKFIQNFKLDNKCKSLGEALDKIIKRGKR